MYVPTGAPWSLPMKCARFNVGAHAMFMAYGCVVLLAPLVFKRAAAIPVVASEAHEPGDMEAARVSNAVPPVGAGEEAAIVTFVGIEVIVAIQMISGSVYSNTTPSTERGVLLPFVRIPARDNVIPAGKGAPTSEIVKLPPDVTPLGSVSFKSIVSIVPLVKYRCPTFQITAVPVGESAVVDGDALPVGNEPSLDGFSDRPDASSQQPASSVAQPTAPIARALLRLIRLIISSIHHRNVCIKSIRPPSRVAPVHDR